MTSSTLGGPSGLLAEEKKNARVRYSSLSSTIVRTTPDNTGPSMLHAGRCRNFLIRIPGPASTSAAITQTGSFICPLTLVIGSQEVQRRQAGRPTASQPEAIKITQPTVGTDWHWLLANRVSCSRPSSSPDGPLRQTSPSAVDSLFLPNVVGLVRSTAFIIRTDQQSRPLTIGCVGLQRWSGSNQAKGSANLCPEFERQDPPAFGRGSGRVAS